MVIKTNRAFSVIELLVSMSIVTLLFGTVLFNYSSSNDSLVVTSAAQELAVTIRQAQAFGLGVKEAGVNTFPASYAYGVYFSPTISPSDYYIFVDRNGNKIYDAGGTCGTVGSECVEKNSLRNNVKITYICDVVSSCALSAGLTAVNITFIRPNPDARIYFSGSSITQVANAVIKLTSPKGTRVMTITVGGAGGVTVQ